MNKAQSFLSLCEEADSDADKFAADIKGAIESIFPDSYVSVKFSTGLGESIPIFFLLGKNKSEFVNGIEHNDPAYTRLFVYGMGRDGSITKPLQLELSKGNILVKSTNPHMAYDRVKVPFRKTTGDQAAILKAVKTYFERLKKALQDNRDRIPDEHLKLIGNKF